MASGTGNLPHPALSFSPFAILTAEEMNDLVENIESIADGTGIGDGSVTTNTLAQSAVTPEKTSNPYKFSVRRNAAANTGNNGFAKIVFDTKNFDDNGDFASGTYTAPVDGIYALSAGFAASIGSGTRIILSFYKNGSEVSRVASAWGSGSSQIHIINGSILIELNNGDTIDVYAFGSSTFALTVSSAVEQPHFEGHLVAVASS